MGKFGYFLRCELRGTRGDSPLQTRWEVDGKPSMGLHVLVAAIRWVG
jgi:hypothetical protein